MKTMREDIATFVRRLESAFRLETCNNNQQLAEAIAYMNYLDSAGDKNICEEALETLDQDAISLLPLTAARPKSGYCGIETPLPGCKLYWVEDPETLFKGRHPSKSWPALVIKHANRVLARKQRNLLWLSDLDGRRPDDTLDSTDVALGLGLYGKSFAHELWLFAVEVDRVHKPTWVDAGFTFVWYAAHRSANHGVTRDLRDGKPRFKEWVVWKKEARITAWNAFSAPPTDQLVADLKELTPAYVDRCRRDVTDCRTANPGATRP